jgi:hypothetical protein
VADAVQTFRAISWLIVKWSLIAIGSLLVLTGLVVGGYFAYKWYTYDRHISNTGFAVEFSEKYCSTPGFPIYVSVANGSDRTINSVTFTLEAKRKGYSGNIAAYNSYASDKIIPPHEAFAWCWKVPDLTDKTADPQSLQWSVSHSSFYRTTLAD